MINCLLILGYADDDDDHDGDDQENKYYQYYLHYHDNETSFLRSNCILFKQYKN